MSSTADNGPRIFCRGIFSRVASTQSNGHRLQARTAALVLNLLLCALILWTTWRAYERLTNLDTAFAQTTVKPRPKAHTPNAPSLDLARITAAHLFGTQASKAAAEPKVQFVPETALDLKLDGVISLDSPGSSQAVIRAGDKPPKAYGVGDVLSRGVVIHEIRSRYVVIRRGSAFETLWLARDKPTDRKQQMIAIDPRRNVAARARAANDVGGPVDLSGSQRHKVVTARQAVFAETTPVSRYVRLQAIHRDGSLAGYRVFPGQKKALFKALQLKAGDLILAVNGIKLSAGDKTPGLVRQLKQSDHIKLGIERGGQQRSLVFDLAP